MATIALMTASVIYSLVALAMYQTLMRMPQVKRYSTEHFFAYLVGSMLAATLWPITLPIGMWLLPSRKDF